MCRQSNIAVNKPLHYKLLVNKQNIFVGFLLIYALFFNYLYDRDTLYIAAFLNFILAAFLALSYRKSAFIFPVLFLYTYVLYSIFIGRYFRPEISPINVVIDYSYDKDALLIALLLTICLIAFIKKSSLFQLSPHIVLMKSKGNNMLSIIALVSAITLQIVYLDTSNVGHRAGYSPLYEYSIVFYILSFYYSRKGSPYLVWLVVSLALFFAFRDFYYGHRVTGLQILGAIYFFKLSRFYTFKRFLYALLVAIPFMFITAAYRAGFSLDINFVKIIGQLFGANLFAFDTAYYAYVASLTFMATHDILSLEIIIGHLHNYIVSLLLPGTYGESLYQISKHYYQHANGGILPYYLYFYLGWIAVPISALLMSFYLNLVANLDRLKFKENSILVFSYVFVTSPRWIIYSPNQLLRGVMIFFAVLYGFIFLERTLKYVGLLKGNSMNNGKLFNKLY